MRYIVCGTVVHQEYEDDILQLSNAANRFLLNFTNEIKKIYPIKILSYVGIDISTEIKEKLRKRNNSDSDLAYYFKSRFKVAGVVAYWHAVSRNLRDAECIIAYNPVYAYLNVPYMAHRHKKKSILILADYSPEETYKGRLRRIYALLQLKSIRKYDMVIGLSENTKVYLADNQEFIHMPGGINGFVYDYFREKRNSEESDKIVLMYAGTLEKVTGIDMLLEAFEQIEDEDVELWISGKGSMVSLVEQFVEKDDRIKYLGCPSYNEYLDNLKSADILVNPRNMDLPENKNNFPSKILEYLATGKQIVSTKFPGWEKFADYISFCEKGIKNMRESLKCAYLEAMREKDQRYKKNRQFAEQFLWSRQMEKVLKNVEMPE